MNDKYIGQIIGNFEIIELEGKDTDGHKLYIVKCIKCGKLIHNMRISACKTQNLTNSCVHISLRDFNWYSDRLANIYYNMVRRCNNESDKSYRFYGGKGIKVCDVWLDSKKSFNDWAVSSGYDDTMSIDRVDSSKDYSPDNCRWITPKENSKWKSTTTRLEVNGIIDSGKGWSTRLGLPVNHINNMVRNHGIDYTIKWIGSRLDNV